jgi:hypothetical protein
MSEQSGTSEYVRQRAEREIAIAKATGSKAHASPDWRTIFIERRDGTRETIRVPDIKPN